MIVIQKAVLLIFYKTPLSYGVFYAEKRPVLQWGCKEVISFC